MNRKGFRKDMMRGLAVGLTCLSLVSPVYDVNHNYGQGRDVISGSRVNAAMADAAVEVTSRPLVVKKLRDRTIFDLGNGRKKAEVYPNDVRFKDDKGEYQDYDTSLVKKNHEYTTANSDKMSHFPEKIDRESPITTENDEYSIDMFWGTKGKKTSSNMQIGQEKVEDIDGETSEKITSVTYGGFDDNVKLRYESSIEGMKETIILGDRDSSREYGFKLDLKNCQIISLRELQKDTPKYTGKISTKAGENLYIYDLKKDRLVGALPSAFMIDAKGRYSDACRYEISLVDRREEEDIYSYRLKLVLDDELLDSDKCAYPVEVDPSVVWDNTTAAKLTSGYVCRTSPEKVYTKNNTCINCVGKREKAEDVCRTYINFSGINSGLYGKYIESAKLTVKTVDSSVDMPIYIKTLSQRLNMSTLSYNNQPSKVEKLVGEFKTTKSSEMVSIDLDTDVLYNRSRNAESIYGFEFSDSPKDDNMTSSKRAWIFNESTVNAAKMPKLELTYSKFDSSDSPELSYDAKLSYGGYAGEEQDGVTCGYIGEDESFKGISMSLADNGYQVKGVMYRAYFENSGWSDWKTSGMISAENNGDMKAIEAKVYEDSACKTLSTKYNIFYRTYIKDKGWLGWAKNGEEAGDYQDDATIEGFQAVVVPRLKYKVNATRNNGNIKSSIYSDKDFSGEVDKGERVYGIGCQFADYYMTQKHAIDMDVYYENSANNTTVKSSNNGTYNQGICNQNNKIVGYNAYLDDIDLRAKYDIIHLAKMTYDDDTEAFVSNKKISGSKVGSGLAEFVGIRLVPKDYDYGKKSCLSDRFIPEQDGYSFVNTGSSFQYYPNYKIPLSKYRVLYGDFEGETLYRRSKSWGGSCFGMSFSSMALQRGYWNIRGLLAPCMSTANSTNSLFSKQYTTSEKTKDLIEYVQLTAGFHYDDKTYDNSYDNYKVIRDKLMASNGHGYIMILQSLGYIDGKLSVLYAHAVVPTGIEQVDGNGEYKITLYDPNKPGTTSVASVNTRTNKASYDTYTRFALLDVKKMLEEKDDVFDVIWNNSTTGDDTMYAPASVSDSNQIFLFGDNSAEICDSEGNKIHESKIRYIGADLAIVNAEDKSYTIKCSGKQKADVLISNGDTCVDYTLDNNKAVIEAAFDNKDEIETRIKSIDKNAKVVMKNSSGEKKKVNSATRGFRARCGIDLIKSIKGE